MSPLGIRRPDRSARFCDSQDNTPLRAAPGVSGFIAGIIAAALVVGLPLTLIWQIVK